MRAIVPPDAWDDMSQVDIPEFPDFEDLPRFTDLPELPPLPELEALQELAVPEVPMPDLDQFLTITTPVISRAWTTSEPS